jgi:histone acetyltransferase (RNA polymerase elongator complex component)
MALGIQLLPGLPGDEPGVFLADVCETAFIQPEVARLYPCLVIKGTPLASIWERGEFLPWSVARAVEELAEALPVLWEHDIRVIRLGLPPEGTLDENVLAGPHHPALGQSARGLALFHLVSAHVDRLGQPPVQLDVPRRYQGELMGHGGELIEQYASIGIMREMIHYSASSEFVLS